MTSPVLGVYPDGWPQMYRDAKRPEGEDPQDGDLLFRASTESQMSLCPARTEKKTVASEKMFFGTVQHGLIEEHPDKQITPVDVLEMARVKFDEEGLGRSLDSVFSDIHDESEWVTEQVVLHGAWRRWYGAQQAAGFRIVERELSMIAPLFTVNPGMDPALRQPNPTVWLGGTPDAIAEHAPTGGLYGWDWKTAGRMWRQGKADGSRQDDTYAWLYHRITGTFIEDWWFVIGDRGKQEWKALETKVSRGSADSAVHVIERQAQYLLSGLPMVHSPHDGFGKRGWHCCPQFCANWGGCGGRRLGDEYDDLPAEESTW